MAHLEGVYLWSPDRGKELVRSLNSKSFILPACKFCSGTRARTVAPRDGQIPEIVQYDLVCGDSCTARSCKRIRIVA